jgi:serine phosphatase RsbU (regulator of sigma subunit)
MSKQAKMVEIKNIDNQKKIELLRIVKKTRNDSTRSIIKKVKSISKIGKEIVSHSDLEKIICLLSDKINKLMPAPVIIIGKVGKRNLNLIDFYEYRTDSKKFTSKYGKVDDINLLSSWCIRNRKKVVINDLAIDYSKYVNDVHNYTSDEEEVQSIICLPLILHSITIGVLEIRNFDVDSYNKVHLTILRNLAVYLSIAMYNSDQYHFQKILNENVLGSIRYGLTIQNAILPKKQILDKYLESFIIYQPKDIVSGDFYWFTDKLPGNKLFIALVDCTGHGVPGAFMTMIANMLLNNIINENKIFDPEKAMEFLDSQLKKILSQQGNHSGDGMDVTFCLIENIRSSQVKLSFCGAKHTLFHYCKKEEQVNDYKGDRRSIGGITSKAEIVFKNKSIYPEKGDMIYLTTDGIIDQNSSDRKRFGSKKLIELFQQIAKEQMDNQKTLIESKIVKYRVNEELRDDISVIGLKF